MLWRSGCLSARGGNARLFITEIILPFMLLVPILTFVFIGPFLLKRDILIPRQRANTTISATSNHTDADDDSHDHLVLNTTGTIFDTFPMPVNTSRTLRDTPKLLFVGAGVSLGSIVGGISSDVFFQHRDLVRNLMASLAVVFGLASTVAPTYAAFALLWALVGFGVFGAYSVAYVRAAEAVSERHRLKLLLFMFGPLWLLSEVSGALIGYLVHQWHTVVFSTALWLCVVLILVVSVTSILKRQPPRPTVFTTERCWHVLTHPRARLRLLAHSFNWFTCGFVWWGLIYSVGAPIPGTFYASFLFGCLLEFVAEILAAGSCLYLGRTLAPLSAFMLLNGLCFFAMTPFTNCAADSGWRCSNPSVIFAQLATFISAGSWNIVWAVTVHSFPTRMRNTAVGLCSFWARMGAILGIVIVDQRLIYTDWHILVAAGLLCLVSAVVTLFCMEERATKPLIESFEQEDDEKRKLNGSITDEHHQPGANSKKPQLDFDTAATASNNVLTDPDALSQKTHESGYGGSNGRASVAGSSDHVGGPDVTDNVPATVTESDDSLDGNGKHEAMDQSELLEPDGGARNYSDACVKMAIPNPDIEKNQAVEKPDTRNGVSLTSAENVQARYSTPDIKDTCDIQRTSRLPDGVTANGKDGNDRTSYENPSRSTDSPNTNPESHNEAHSTSANARLSDGDKDSESQEENAASDTDTKSSNQDPDRVPIGEPYRISRFLLSQLS